MNPALPSVWYYVYILDSKSTRWIYIVCTNNLKKRLQEHTEGKVFSTRKMRPIRLIYFEAYRSKYYAYMRERHLKQYGNSLTKLKSRIGIKV